MVEVSKEPFERQQLACVSAVLGWFVWADDARWAESPCCSVWLAGLVHSKESAGLEWLSLRGPQ